MKNAVILHGKPDKEEYYDLDKPAASNDHWIPWLQKQLTILGIDAQTPELLNAWEPHYPVWQKEFERYDITPNTMLVGHSCGGGFIIRWLSEHKDVYVGRIVLVAPSLGNGWSSSTDFFNFEIDPSLTSRTKGLTIFESDNDMPGIKDAYQILRSSIKDANYREFHNYGHFCVEDTGRTDFPELLEELTKDRQLQS